jgi:hypothetical protein
MRTSTGRFAEEAMTRSMHDVADLLCVDSADASLLRLTNNAVFALPSAGIVIRITRSYGLHDRVHKVVRLARWFEEVNAPTIRLAPSIDQPVRVGDVLATVWRLVASTPSAPSVADLGVALRAFHRLAVPPFPLPSWDPVGDAHRRIGDAEALTDADRAFLLDWCQRLEPRVGALNDRAGQMVHGDAHVGNLLREPTGDVVLCDFDPTCVGPRQVDLAAVAVGDARFGRVGNHSALVAAYGYDVTADPDWQTLREARELKMVVAAVPLLASGSGIAEEFGVRIRSIMDGNETARWTPFANLHR